MMQLKIHVHDDEADQKLKKRTQKAGASKRSLHVLKIRDQSTTMLTMLTKNEKIAPERRVRRIELTRAAAGKFEQKSKPIEFTTKEWTHYEKTQ